MSEDDHFKIALTGDSIIMREITQHKDKNTQELYNLIKDADVSFTNLEILPNNFKGYPAARTDGAPVSADSSMIDELTKMGFNLFSCANNHTGDYSAEGLLETLKQLRKRNIYYSGIGENLTNSRMPCYLPTSKGTAALISCSSTAFKEQIAGESRPEIQGRPGVNPLRYKVTYEVTKEQMKVLREIYKELGLQKIKDNYVKLGFTFDDNDESTLKFEDSNFRTAETINANFKIGEETGIKTYIQERDNLEIQKWIKDTKMRSDISIVSIHAHEQGEKMEDPADFIKSFAYKAIDNGANIVVGHGPHYLKGIEIYKGCPIFYSLGNFIGHNELINKLPQDTYENYRIDTKSTPSEFFTKRSNNGKKGFVANSIYWESIVPLCCFEKGNLKSIFLYPITLENKSSANRRGRPYFSDNSTSNYILNKIKKYSSDFGTVINIKDNLGVINVKGTDTFD